MVTMTKPESRPIYHVHTETLVVTAYCLNCKDMSSVEANFVNGVFHDIVETSHIREYGTGQNTKLFCICGGDVRLFIPSKMKI